MSDTEHTRAAIAAAQQKRERKATKRLREMVMRHATVTKDSVVFNNIESAPVNIEQALGRAERRIKS